MGTRAEQDGLGIIQVADERLWGAQTERSLQNFRISEERMPPELIAAFVLVKKAAAIVNKELGMLEEEIADAIVMATEEVFAGEHPEEFPLSVWQTGSGTQTNMNVNEVLANRASELLGGVRGVDRIVHPNDHVNCGQSSNDTFPSAMILSAADAIRSRVLPKVTKLQRAIEAKAVEYRDVVKIGRTHLMDATPLTLGQELSGWASQLEHGLAHLSATVPHLCELPLGATAVGTGMNTHPSFGARVAEKLALLSGHPITTAPNKFEALSAHDAIVQAHGALKGLAVSLMKIANDVRWLASGPRAGIGEILIPANEPGSSIMPGKVNATQAEALAMVCAQVMGNDVAITVAGASGNFQLNVMKPLITYDFLMSCRLLSDACDSFSDKLISGLTPNYARIEFNLNQSLMLATALTPHIGYDRAGAIVSKAREDGTTLREAALRSGLSAEDYDRWVRPVDMTKPLDLPDPAPPTVEFDVEIEQG